MIAIIGYPLTIIWMAGCTIVGLIWQLGWTPW